MQVFLVKHCTTEMYIASNKPPRLLTDKRNQAFRFGTHALADAARRQMKVPLQWEVIACDWDTLRGQIASQASSHAGPTPNSNPQPEDQR